MIDLNFGSKKFTFKTEYSQILTTLNQVVLQDIKKPFEEAHWVAKIY